MVINNIFVIFTSKLSATMFKENNQSDLFSFENQLLDNEQQKRLSKTKEKAFYNLIFRNIKESDYNLN